MPVSGVNIQHLTDYCVGYMLIARMIDLMCEISCPQKEDQYDTGWRGLRSGQLASTPAQLVMKKPSSK
jgi:hypothetical protein